MSYRIPSMDATANERRPKHVTRKLTRDRLTHHAEGLGENAMVMQARPPMPEDNRSLTARICGDPAPNDPRRQR